MWACDAHTSHTACFSVHPLTHWLLRWGCFASPVATLTAACPGSILSLEIRVGYFKSVGRMLAAAAATAVMASLAQVRPHNFCSAAQLESPPMHFAIHCRPEHPFQSRIIFTRTRDSAFRSECLRSELQSHSPRGRGSNALPVPHSRAAIARTNDAH